ncbi:MAG: hypothetical protein KY428_05275 [Bacteroidetes bacterium]|nr:hypothetical protein [Bacteroidota bacterium]
MANASIAVIHALRRTAQRIQKGAPYQWGHMGSCNCGHLAQELTQLSKAEIHQRALQSRSGDWREQLNDYCPTSGLPMDGLIGELINFGFDVDDLRHLERLSDPKVLAKLPPEKQQLRHNFRDDVVSYLNTWALLLEDRWLAKATLPRLKAPETDALSMPVISFQN